MDNSGLIREKPFPLSWPIIVARDIVVKRNKITKSRNSRLNSWGLLSLIILKKKFGKSVLSRRHGGYNEQRGRRAEREILKNVPSNAGLENASLYV